MIVFKALETDIRADGDRRMRFVISTGAVDRDGDRLDPQGWVLDRFKKNPVVMWSHAYSQPPVAKCTEIRVTRTGLEATAEFPPRGMYEFSDTVFDMLKGGFLSGVSVGFRPIEFEESRVRKGRDYRRQELTEFSLCSIPSNPDALVRRSADAWVKSIKDWAAHSPSPKKEDPIMPRDNKDEIVLRIKDDPHAPPPHLVARAVMGRAKIDRYNELCAAEEAARQAKHDAWLVAKGFKEERP
jgi:HK97 family phage prohead protease